MGQRQHLHAWVVVAGGLLLCSVAVALALYPRPGALPVESDAPTHPALVYVPSGVLSIAPSDWEALGKVASMDVLVAAFHIDATEVTHGSWNTCVSSGECDELPSSQTPTDPRTPVTLVTPAQANGYCQFRSGRLPERAEWLFAAASPEGNRYPWGQTGLVCRRAVYGMVTGPCHEGHSAPLAVASRAAGATTTGIYDLSGNVSEWVLDGDGFVAVGGSFRSTLAGQLKVWSLEDVRTARDDVGFRCVYASTASTPQR